MSTRICFAMVLTLLTVAVPVRAATITVDEFVNLSFGNGYTASGSLKLLYIPVYMGGTPFVPCLDCQSQPPNLQLYFDSSPLAPYDGRYGDLRGLGNLTGWPLLFLSPDLGVDGISVSSLDHVPANFADFTLNGDPAIGGDVSTAPVPAALPLFGSALLGLAGLAWRRNISTQDSNITSASLRNTSSTSPIPALTPSFASEVTPNSGNPQGTMPL